MKVALGAVVAAVLGLVAATVWIAARVREDTVVANPYAEGLRLGSGRGHAGGRDEAAAPALARGASGPGACDLGSGPCTAALPGGGDVRLELSPRPLRTMADLAVRVELGAGEPPAAVSVAFSMRGMDMGENRARLAPAGPRRFEGKGVLVRCPGGGREWVADVEVSSPGAAARSARFSLTVAE
ncbi:MAG TPA: hypothetical protein VIW03_16080 [Anaeromyxobacter sp.]